MIPLSWRNLKSWNCVECGMCCKDYHVVLNYAEWLNIVGNYGIEKTIAGTNKLLLGKKSNGTCSFLTHYKDTCYCGLQYMKPTACKIWPFKIFLNPKFGKPDWALYRYRNKSFYIYVDSACTGLSWGKPTPELMYRVLPEFIDVAIGLRKQQFYSTSKIQTRISKTQFRGRNLF